MYVDGLSKRIQGNPEQQAERPDSTGEAEAQVEGAEDLRRGLGDRTMVGEFLEELGVLLGGGRMRAFVGITILEPIHECQCRSSSRDLREKDDT